MRHRVGGYKLGRTTSHRKAMWRNQAISLFTHGQITTSVPKAKAVQPFVEKLISLAKKGDLASRRRVIQAIGNPLMIKGADDPHPDIRVNRRGELVDGPKVVAHLFDEIGPRYSDRDGGYTRIVRLTKHRIGDGTQLCVLQLVGDEPQRAPGHGGRRREQANKRMEFAAKIRKGGAVEEEEAPAEEEASTEAAEEAAAEEATEEQTDAPAAEEAAGEDEEKKE